MSVIMPMSQPQAAAPSDVQEHVVRVPRERRKKFSMMRMGSGVDLDFAKLHTDKTSVRIERENNFKEFKNAYDIDTMPKFGAGSEYGRQQKEEARRKKYGIRVRNYHPEDQPWMLDIGSGKNKKRYKGVREGTISDNTSYYIFTKCADGAFEAVPVEEWYNFSSQIRYKFLNMEEAEEEFSRRDKTMNKFNIMVKRRVRNDVGEAEEEQEKLPKGSKKKKDFTLTDMEDWGVLSDDGEEDDDDDEDLDGGAASKKKGGKGKGKKGKKKSKNSKHNSDDEAIEESDEGDYDDREVDYMSDSGMSSSDSEVEEKGEKRDKYEEKGVDEEAGLRKLIDSEEEDEEDAEKEEENEDDKDKDGKGKKQGSDSDSSSSSSESDSDIEKDDNIASALFMQKGSEKEKKKERTASPKPDDRGTKRKMDGEGAVVKKPRTDSPLTIQGAAGGSSEGISENAIRRYLMRKPMTTKDLLQKFRSKKLNMTNEQMTHTIAQLLKRINPDKKVINKVMYLSIKSE